MRFPLLLFDLDGTLVDSLPDIVAGLNWALASVGRAPLAPDTVRGLVGEGVVRLSEKALAFDVSAPAVDASRLAERITARFRESPATSSRLYPGVVETLAALKTTRGRHLAVLTNKPGEIARAMLASLGVLASFDAVVGDGDGFPRKPDPAGARSLIARFGADDQRTLMIGDGVPDLALARAVGCPSAAALWGYTDRTRLEAESPTFLAASPGDLVPLV